VLEALVQGLDVLSKLAVSSVLQESGSALRQLVCQLEEKAGGEHSILAERVVHAEVIL